MLKNHNRDKILEQFFIDPVREGGFQLREISRETDIAPPSAKKYLLELEKAGIITKKRIHNYPVYFANRDNEYYRFLKRIATVKGIHETGLLQYLHEKLLPDAIMLFGSAARGEDTKESDIDIFLQCKEKELDLAAFEHHLHRKINTFFAKDFNKLSPELKNNIINGIILKGYLKVF